MSNKQIITRKQELEPKAFAGPEDFFTGAVKVEPLFNPNETLPISGAYVTFEAKARTAWHKHPKGQFLIVTNGEGLTQYEDGKVEKFKAGDVVWCSTDVKHWHGATEDSSMTHIAITGIDEKGNAVEWLNKVSNEEYQSKE